MSIEKAIEDKVRTAFPEFEITDEMTGLPTVIFTFLAVWLYEAMKKKDYELVRRFANFVNLLSTHNDKVVIACLSEIFLGLYCSTEINYKDFEAFLSEKAKEEFQKNIDAWDSVR